jgi:hypothetical protein
VWRRCGAGNVRRSGVGRRVVLLRSRRASWWTTRTRAGTLAPRRGSGLWRLGIPWSALDFMCRKKNSKERAQFVFASYHAHSERNWSEELTVTAGTRLVAPEVLWRPWCRRVETWWALWAEVRWHARRLRRLLRWRSQTWATLRSASGHYSTEQVAGAVANLRRLGLRRAAVLRALAGTATGLDFALELQNSVLVSNRPSAAVVCVESD